MDSTRELPPDEAAEMRTHEEVFELPIAGFQGTPEQIERQWFEQVYKGRGDSMAQLTWRAVVMGSLLGSVLSLTNLYMGLKTGWGFGVAVTACILSYAFWTGLYRLGLVRTEMTILENNCMQSTASSAGYSTGGTLISAFAAYMILNPLTPLTIPMTLAWVFFIAVLGVTMAIPMKRQMVNVDQLRFPSGIAAAETLKVLHAHGSKGVRSARGLTVAAIVAAASQFWMDGFGLVKFAIGQTNKFSLKAVSGNVLFDRFNATVFGTNWINRTVSFEWDIALLAGGALTGMRASASMFLGGTLCWAVFVPVLQHRDIIPMTNTTGYRDIVLWTLWGGVSCMITSSLLAFAFQWRSAVRAFRSMAEFFIRGRKKTTTNEMDAIEVPTSWFLGGQLFALIGLAWLAYISFHMPLWQSVTAVLMTFILALVACRVTGETDTTPIGAMGKVTQLVFGVLSPGNMNVNLMSANITAGSAASAADLLTDLKSGYLLGANPRKQFLAQFAGIFSGTLVTVLCFRVLVPTAEVLQGTKFPAPSARAWAAVATVLKDGITSLGPLRAWTIGIGGLIGIILPVLCKLFPKYEKWIPSAAALGLAWTFPWSNSLMFFLGALAAYAWEKIAKKQSEELLYPVASGLIAGGTLMAVAIIFWENGPEILKQMLQPH